MKKFATIAIIGAIMACSAVSASAATELNPIISPQATVVVQPTTGISSDKDTNTDDSNKSPQTGDFDATPYVVASLSMAAVAVACKAVKTSKEQ